MSIRNAGTLFSVLTLSALLIVSTTIAAGKHHSQNPKADQIESLLLDQKIVLSKLVDYWKRKFEQGQGSQDDVWNAENDLLNVELQLATSKEERVKLLKAKFENFKAIEFRATELQRVGAKGGETYTVLKSTSNRIAAEIELLKESDE